MRLRLQSESISELVKKASSVGPRRMKSMRGVQIAPESESFTNREIRLAQVK